MRVKISLMVVLAMVLAGCAATPHDTSKAPDRFERFNRVTYKVNTFGSKITKPIGRAQKKIVPQPIRTGISNFFDNITYPVTIVNSFLQGKFKQGGADVGRFLLNSTVGVAGIFDPATDVGLEKHDEDFGQTLATWGVPSGPYLMLPVFGPTTLRDAGGLALDIPLNPLRHYENTSVRDKLDVLYAIELRAQLLALEEQVEASLDPYIFVREAYLQNRNFQIFDGNPPAAEIPDDEFDEISDEDLEGFELDEE
ncbi:MAG: VacJ family lipoprotein [Pseudomonadota bacterium]